MKKLGLCFLLLGATIAAHAQQITGENVAVANTDAGKVRGYINNSIFTYKGIPYAEANRFESPQKPKPWTGVRSSMTYGPVAPLMTPTNVTAAGDESEFVFNHSWGFAGEDCMRLNIWTPKHQRRQKASGDVLDPRRWIHCRFFTRIALL